MSEGEVEVLRTAYELAQSRGVDGLLEMATDDVVWISDPSFPGGGTYEGKANVRQWLSTLWIYDELSIDVDEIIDLEGRVLGVTRFHAVPREGPRVEWRWCHLVSFRGGLICRAQSFLDRESALEAAWRG